MRQNSAVVFVTHEINPIIDYVDRVLYLAGGRFRVGTPEEVMTTEVLSRIVRQPCGSHPRQRPHRRGGPAGRHHAPRTREGEVGYGPSELLNAVFNFERLRRAASAGAELHLMPAPSWACSAA